LEIGHAQSIQDLDPSCFASCGFRPYYSRRSRRTDERPAHGIDSAHHHSLDSELQRRFLKYQITAPPVTGPSPGINLDFESLGRIHGHPGGK